MIQFFTPHLLVESVLDLTPTRLAALGIEALLLDVDCTLKRYRETSIPEPVAAWLAGLRAAGIEACLVSNGRGPRIGQCAQQLGLPFVSQACKPLPFGCRAGQRKLGVSPQHTAMVGDQVFADVVAARLSGLRSILVRPIHPEEEPWFTRLKRPMERWLVRALAARIARLSDDPQDVSQRGATG